MHNVAALNDSLAMPHEAVTGAKMTQHPFYLSPTLARENLIASRLLNEARRIRKREAAAMEEAIRLFARHGWAGQAAVEMAEAHKRVTR